MAETIERREDHRFEIDLVTQVTAKSADGGTFSEKTILRNISGAGASFITHQADRYFQEQQLNITIDLPGTVEMKACLEGTATVSRIEPLPGSDPRQDTPEYAVAVVIAVPLRFVRKDTETGADTPAGKLR